MPLFVALHRSFVKDENLELDITMMLPQIAHNALFTGEVDFHGAADSALCLAAKGAAVTAIFFGATRPNYFLMAKPAIRSVPELKASISVLCASATPSNWNGRSMPQSREESYASLPRSNSQDGTSSDAGLRFDVQHIQRSAKGIGDIPVSKIADFRLLEEVRRALAK